MKSAFRKISRIRNLAGGTNWYLSEDCLLAAKRVMYTVEYRRFYLQDLESIVVWPNNSAWMLRMIIPGAVFALLDLAFSQWASLMTGAVFGGIGAAWVALELALGPTARSRIRTTGASVDLPLVPRARRARKLLAKIDAAIRNTRSAAVQPPASVASAEAAKPAVQTTSEGSAPASIADTTQTNGS